MKGSYISEQSGITFWRNKSCLMGGFWAGELTGVVVVVFFFFSKIKKIRGLGRRI